jgi:hypothetical protein
MALTQPQRAFGIFFNLRDAESAINELKAIGFPMAQVSAIARDPQGNNVEILDAVGTKAQEGTTIGAIAGGTVGGAIGLAVGLGTMAAIPGLGPIMLLGSAATALATTLTGELWELPQAVYWVP